MRGASPGTPHTLFQGKERTASYLAVTWNLAKSGEASGQSWYCPLSFTVQGPCLIAHPLGGVHKGY